MCCHLASVFATRILHIVVLALALLVPLLLLLVLLLLIVLVVVIIVSCCCYRVVTWPYALRLCGIFVRLISIHEYLTVMCPLHHRLVVMHIIYDSHDSLSTCK